MNVDGGEKHDFEDSLNFGFDAFYPEMPRAPISAGLIVHLGSALAAAAQAGRVAARRTLFALAVTVTVTVETSDGISTSSKRPK